MIYELQLLTYILFWDISKEGIESNARTPGTLEMHDNRWFENEKKRQPRYKLLLSFLSNYI